MESSGPEVVLVVGSFPPVPTPAAAATVAAVRRELSPGHTVVTASPRPSAASLVLLLRGSLGSWRLERVRRSTGAANLVLSLEPGWRLPPGIVLELRRFTRVTLLVSDVTAPGSRVLRRLRSAVDDVVLSGSAARSNAVATIARALPRVTLRVVEVPPLAPAMSGATPLGPGDPGWQPSAPWARAVGGSMVGALTRPGRLITRLAERGGPVSRALRRIRSTIIPTR